MDDEFAVDVTVNMSPRWRQPATTLEQETARDLLRERFAQMAFGVEQQLENGIAAEKRAAAVLGSLYGEPVS